MHKSTSSVSGKATYVQSGASNQKVRKEETFRDPLLVPTEHLLNEVSAFVEAAGHDIDALLDRSEACWRSLKNEGYNPIRGCLVKCALAQHIERHLPDANWTRTQRSRHDALMLNVQLHLLSVGLIGELPKSSRQAVLDTAVRHAAQGAQWSEDFVQLVNLCPEMRKVMGAEGLSMARFLLDSLDKALPPLKKAAANEQERKELLQFEECLSAAYVQQLKASYGVEEMARLLVGLDENEPRVHELLICLRRMDPMEILSIRLPSKAAAASRIARAADIARRLAEKPQLLQMLFDRVPSGGSPVADKWIDFLLFVQFYVDETKKALPLTGWSQEQDVSLFVAYIRENPSIKKVAGRAGSAMAMVLELWLFSVLEDGAGHAPIALALLSCLNGAASSQAGLVFERELTDALLSDSGLPKTIKEKLPVERWGALRTKVIDMAIADVSLFRRIFPPPEVSDDALRAALQGDLNHVLEEQVEEWLKDVQQGVLEGASEDRLDIERHTRRAQLLSDPRWLLNQPRWLLSSFRKDWTLDERRDATLSVDAVFRMRRQARKDFAQKHGDQAEMGLSMWCDIPYPAIVGVWAAIAQRHPDWLKALSSEHPWLPEVIQRVTAKERVSVAALMEPLERAAAKKNAQALTSLV